MSDDLENPYRWDTHNPKHPIKREDLLKKVSTKIRRGESGYLVGTRGMGKSVFLRQLKDELSDLKDEILHFRTAPVTDEERGDRARATSEMVVDELILRCGERGMDRNFIKSLKDRKKSSDILGRVLEAYLERPRQDARQNPLILLFDELDSYADFGRPFFHRLEDLRKESAGRLVVFCAGGIGLLALDTVISSAFFSRLSPTILEPFRREDLDELAEPFAEYKSPLAGELLDTLHKLSGGNPALSTYGLQTLWDAPELSHDVLTHAFRIFHRDNDNFIQHVREPIFDARLSTAPVEAWRELKKHHGQMSAESFWNIVRGNEKRSPTLQKSISNQWIFRMLRATGLIRCSEDAYNADPIQVEIIPSIFTLRDDVLDENKRPEQKASIREQLLFDLDKILRFMHGASPDFVGSKEGTLSSTIAAALDGPQWEYVEREAQSGAGRTDIKATSRRFPGAQVIVEVKWWDRNDYARIHGQVVDYWRTGTEALATVMFSTVQDPILASKFRRVCFEEQGLQVQEKATEEPIAAHYVVAVQPPKGKVDEVDHLLLRFAKRSSSKPSK